jgi:hypothetical protein
LAIFLLHRWAPKSTTCPVRIPLTPNRAHCRTCATPRVAPPRVRQLLLRVMAVSWVQQRERKMALPPDLHGLSLIHRRRWTCMDRARARSSQIRLPTKLLNRDAWRRGKREGEWWPTQGEDPAPPSSVLRPCSAGELRSPRTTSRPPPRRVSCARISTGLVHEALRRHPGEVGR